MTIDAICDAGMREVKGAVFPTDVEFEDVESRAGPPSCPEFDESAVAELIHDIRNTLGAVASLSELALIDLPANSRSRGMAYEVQQACREASQQCHRVLTAFRGSRASIVPTDLSALIRDAAPLLATCIPPSSVLRYSLASGLPLLDLTPGDIRQVVMNLVKNAGEAVRERPGIVTISTGWIPAAAAGLDFAGLTSIRALSHVFLAVSDTGCGIDEPTRIGLMAGRSTSNSDGHGLGFASVRRVVANHKARLQLHSRWGTGTTVRVVFDAGATVHDAGARCLAPSEPDAGVEEIRILQFPDPEAASYCCDAAVLNSSMRQILTPQTATVRRDPATRLRVCSAEPLAGAATH